MGVRITRLIVFWGLYWEVPLFRETTIYRVQDLGLWKGTLNLGPEVLYVIQVLVLNVPIPTLSV